MGLSLEIKHPDVSTSMDGTQTSSMKFVPDLPLVRLVLALAVLVLVLAVLVLALVVLGLLLLDFS